MHARRTDEKAGGNRNDDGNSKKALVSSVSQHDRRSWKAGQETGKGIRNDEEKKEIERRTSI